MTLSLFMVFFVPCKKIGEIALQNSTEHLETVSANHPVTLFVSEELNKYYEVLF